MLKLYADESLNDDTSLMNVSGFLMTEDQFTDLDNQVREGRGNLPYFHMKERHHLKYPDIYQKLVGLVTPASVLAGFSASLRKDEYRQITRERLGGQPISYWIGTEYTCAVGLMMALCSDWVGKSTHRDELIAYVFEAGHENQGDADMFWGQVTKPYLAHLQRHYRYASHTFVDGKGPLGSVLQLCDILAWNVTKSNRDGRSTPEFARMCKVNIRRVHYGPKEISAAIELQKERWSNFDSRGRPRS